MKDLPRKDILTICSSKNKNPKVRMRDWDFLWPRQALLELLILEGILR